MYRRLSQCVLPVDDLLKASRRTLDPWLRQLQRRPGLDPVQYWVTLETVTHRAVVEAATAYIDRLLQHKEQYGYPYFLLEQRMLIPLSVFCQSMTVFVDPRDQHAIETKVEELASRVARKGEVLHEVTLVELYYFFIRLWNGHLTWLAVESMANSFGHHTHLIMSPRRKFGYRDLAESPVPEECRRTTWRCEKGKKR